MTERYLNIKNKTLIRLSVIMALLFALFLFITYVSYRQKLENTLSGEAEHLKAFFKSELNALNELNYTRIDNILSNQDVINAIEQRDRIKLYTLVKQNFDLFAAENHFFKNMHFHTENTVTILRVHMPAQYGDDLSKIRHIIAKSNQEKLPESGIEVGLNGIYYRVVQPVYNSDHKHIGCLELGTDPMYFTHLLETMYTDKKLAFVFKKDSLNILRNKDGLVLAGNEYIKTDTPDFFVKALKYLKKQKMITYESEGRTYLIAPVMELKNYSNESIASLVAAIDVTKSIEDIKDDVLILLLFSIIIAAATLTVVNIGFNAYIGSLHRTSSDLNRAKDELNYNHKIIDKYVIYSEADAKGVITKVSTALCEISQFSRNELIGAQHTILKHPDMDQNMSRQMWNTIMSGNSWNGDIKNIRKDGSTFWVNAHIVPKIDESGNFIGYSSIRTDITDKKRVEELTITDEQTGLYNKRYFNQIIEQEMRRAQRNRSFMTLAIIDIDAFKAYNDSYGHLAGDNVMKSIAATIKKSLNRAGDFAFRIGGEAFAVICTEMNTRHSKEFFEQIREDVENLKIEHTTGDTGGYITVSIGVCCAVPPVNATSDLLFKKADTSLCKAKESGRNRVKICDGNET
ncbi:diguanylate cyclase [Seleniivibrio woodruffii]|uniref:sensor domain-containing diguanylate cyclase n=1 Tax=Seleniivibrio woodruffii TaxID=1078050 RepID=UPI0026F23DC8|nr:diguanylate cyclase [Seleniivibrio woodruffii]